MRKSTSGFSHLYLLLFFVVAAIAAGGWYVWHKNHKSAPVAAVSSSTNIAASSAVPAKTVNTINLAKLPLGDGKVTTTGAKKGYVYSCTSNFRGGGAQHAGTWIGTTTWNAEAKPTVDGSVSWPNANVKITLNGSSRIISGNGLPVDTMTGVFPIKSGSTAYQYDRNPNSILAQSDFITLSAEPSDAATPGCLGLGPIGYMTNGVALFDALDAGGRDAAAHEIQDKCDGHPQSSGIYHYHSMSSCIPAQDKNNTLVGYALDGYGIFSDRDASGRQYTTADLDACHGITSLIPWNGKMVDIYHYVLTHDYPYSLGCYHGTAVASRPSA